MSGRTFFYTAWCMGVVLLFMATGYYSWSPFADGGRTRSGMGGVFVGGPRHK
ncbi:hypothetical protein [Sphingomonas sp.]|uniref:hypothetical protein n=1 Tax=Sphingomonas sp. TaxID=28214 RepID=UPI001DF13637|nr:hypothetical protein [Sphingomonas sp.]MBX9797283.1 hypothetical protein [Sphingomonas sp.]